jgi:hypothetical protein
MLNARGIDYSKCVIYNANLNETNAYVEPKY